LAAQQNKSNNWLITLSAFLSKLGSYLCLGLFWCVAQLPHAMNLQIGRGLGLMSYWLMPRRRAIAEKNINACFSELNAVERQDLARECMIANVQGLLESAKGWWGNTQSILDTASVVGQQHIHQLAQDNSGCILIGGHYTTLDLAGHILGEIWPITILYRPFNNPIFDAAILKARAKNYAEVIDKNKMRHLVRSVQQGGVLWYPADQDYGAKDSVFAPFFGLEAASLATTAGLVKMCRCPVLCLYHHRLPDNTYQLEIRRLDDFDAENSIHAATQVNQAIETGIRQFPAQYMWVHRRFKTRPAGLPDFYAD